LPAFSGSHSYIYKRPESSEEGPAVPSALLRMVTYAADRQPRETKISEQKIEKQDTEHAEERSLARTRCGGIYVNTP